MVKLLYYGVSVDIPSDVHVTVDGYKVTVEGPRGKLTKDFSHIKRFGIEIRLDGNKIIVEKWRIRNRKEKAVIPTIAKKIENMIVGVREGFMCKMKIIYSHFPINVKIDEKNKRVIIENMLGERAPRIAKIVGDDVKVRVEGEDVIIEGIDIENVMQTAANIELATRIKGFDPRKFQDGIYPYWKGTCTGREIWSLI